jgi:hypothetical protein
MESCDPSQLASLALICLKTKQKATPSVNLRYLMSAAGADVNEKARRERLLRHLESEDKAPPAGIGKVLLREFQMVVEKT